MQFWGFFVSCRIVQCANRCNIISRFILWNLLPFITICKKVRKIEMKAWRELTSILIRRDSRRENRAILEIWHLWCKLNCIHPTLLYSSEKLLSYFFFVKTPFLLLKFFDFADSYCTLDRSYFIFFLPFFYSKTVSLPK